MTATAPTRQWPSGVVWVTIPLTLLVGLNTGAQSLSAPVGTGGEISQFNLAAIVHQPEHLSAETLSVTNAEDDIDYVRNVLQLTVTEFAQYMGVSRQAVYDWRSGAHIKSYNLSKLENLKAAADVLAASGIEVTAMQISRKLPGGLTMLEGIAAGTSGRDTAYSLLDLLRREALTREEMKMLLAGRKPTSQSRIGVGMAALRESG